MSIDDIVDADYAYMVEMQTLEYEERKRLESIEEVNNRIFGPE